MDNVWAHAQIISAYSAAPLSFQDKDAGHEFLATLERLPQVKGARLYDKQGQVFATYERHEGQTKLPEAPPRQGHSFAGGHLSLSKPVVHRGENLGTLLIVYDMSEFYDRILRNLVILVFAAMAATGIAFVLAVRLKEALTKPMASLVAVVRHVGQNKDYSLRVPVHAEDEIGELSRAFNQSLDQIQRGELALQAANEELRRRNQEMEQFVYSVSHDLKSPLVTSKGFLGLLKGDIERNEPQRLPRFAMRIEDAADRMVGSIDDLLALSRIGRVPTTPEPLAVSQLVREVFDTYSHPIAEKAITVSIEPRMPTILADKKLMVHLLDNLIGNAIKYACDGTNPAIRVGFKGTKDQAQFFVQDRGPGIASEYQEYIFGLFQRLDSGKEGTGVGLATVRRIAESMGGRAWVESEPGHGATFWIALPLSLVVREESAAPSVSILTAMRA